MVNHRVAKRDLVLDEGGDRVGALGLEQVGWVQSFREVEVGGVEVGSSEVPEVLTRRGPAGGVGVGGHSDAVAAVDEIDVGAQLDLAHSKRGAHRGDADGVAAAAQGDGQCVYRAFDHDRERTRGKEVTGIGVPEERFALGEDTGGAGVEVLRAGVVGVGLGGVATADEAEDRPPARPGRAGLGSA